MSKITFLTMLLFCPLLAFANLGINVDSTKTVGQKTVVKVTIKNDFSEKVESARAQLFLLDDNGKVVGQKSAWIIGGTKERPGLAAGGTTTYNFVVATDKPFTKSEVSVSRVILEGGKVADLPKVRDPRK